MSNRTTDESEPTGYEAYGQLLKDELEAQDKRKASFEQRGLAVITTSGTFVTLLFALAAFSTRKAQTFVLPDSARSWLLGALVLFVGSGVAALTTNIPLKYEATKPDEIKARLEQDPPRSPDRATRDIALTRVEILRDAKRKNGFKGWLLLAALVVEVLAIGCVARAIDLIL